ncbi:hypothetical protein ABZY09_49305, partial [Streptomyces sp. NPDC002928]|uniref:hypothetical protein n=1 Tax=Streptomyces sp. NPDC002928 TaxID=3154440 RepID=UPI0033B14D22
GALHIGDRDICVVNAVREHDLLHVRLFAHCRPFGIERFSAVEPLNLFSTAKELIPSHSEDRPIPSAFIEGNSQKAS